MFTVGIVGYGVVGQRRHKTLQQFENFKVVAVSDKTFSEDTAPKNLKWYSDFKDLILNEKIDDLHKIAKALLIYETLSGDEIRDLILKNIKPTRSFKEEENENGQSSSALGSLGLKPKPAV